MLIQYSRELKCTRQSIIIVRIIYNDTSSKETGFVYDRVTGNVLFSFHVTLLPKSDTISLFAYYVVKYKPIDIHGKSIINDSASNHSVILLTYSKVRGTNRCGRRRGEPKYQDMSCDINFQIILWPCCP